MSDLTSPITTGGAVVVDLSTHDLHLDPDGSTVADERRFEHGPLDRRTCAIFHVDDIDDAHADQWEMHPFGEEAVCCLRGALRLYFRADEPDAADELVARLVPGQVAVIPRGRWHRFEADEPSDLLAVTPRHGTELRSREGHGDS